MGARGQAPSQPSHLNRRCSDSGMCPDSTSEKLVRRWPVALEWATYRRRSSWLAAPQRSTCGWVVRNKLHLGRVGWGLA